MRLSNYVSYIMISIAWLFLELSIAQYSTAAFLGLLINVVSTVIISYRPTYHRYLFIVNATVLTYVGFTIPSSLAFAYSIVLVASVVIYLLLTGMLEISAMALSLFLVYLLYVIERLLSKAPIVNLLGSLIRNSGLNTSLFMAVFTWYFSLFIVSVVIILLIITLDKKIL
ncbi:hypothetical protein [Vulcanisaeta souniana]|uniref:Uncharacterized protein n=1 Tax=Vulcanisaeta souniana JCM 11219 TaxID=1293586 RepID=A0A830EB59_9CREN|nr:hypothetical protein [Vulcanisaeta souniana]BDR92772.1 hypothetical protein Vsou_18650 [Vulcanisaeta souniana JCM 11219]GGI82230.1 hypothetical protein GCM10007112_18740 [Vulcanisaeta souniana JCM 11219]